MHANHLTPCLKQTAFAALLASSVLLGGCAKVYHMVHYNPLAEAVQEHHLPYYHSPKTGRIIPKEHPQACLVELPCFGYEPTCWTRWPGECVKCPVPGETVISDLPFGSGMVVEEVIEGTAEETIEQPSIDGAEIPPEPAPPTDETSTEEPPRLDELIEPTDGASIPVTPAAADAVPDRIAAKSHPTVVPNDNTPDDEPTTKPLVWSESIDLARETYDVMLASAVEPVEETSTPEPDDIFSTPLFDTAPDEPLDAKATSDSEPSDSVAAPTSEAPMDQAAESPTASSKASSRRQPSKPQQTSRGVCPLLPPDVLPAAITRAVPEPQLTSAPAEPLPRFKITPHFPTKRALVDADEGLPKPSPLQVAPLAPVEVRIIAERNSLPSASSDGEKNSIRFR